MRHAIFVRTGLLFAVCVVLGAWQAHAQGSVAGDREALIAFYDSTGGDNWQINDNWKSDKPLGEWYGVGTDEEGRVRKLDLTNNNLAGSIPSKIGDLEKLTNIILESNDITGSIPLEIEHLHQLEILNIRWNNLTGVIPPGIGNLVNLRVINLDVNDITGEIPLGIGNLVNLDTLSFFANDLTGPIPSEIGNLVNLKVITLHGELKGTIPSTIGNLVNLKVIGLSGNNISGEIPSEIGNLVHLTNLYLYENQLTGPIPPEIGNLVNLKVLNMRSNKLSGSLPAEMGNLVELEFLNLRSNQLTGEIPSEICKILLLPKIYVRIVDNSGLINNCAYIPEQFVDNRRKTFTIDQDVDSDVTRPVEFILIQENKYARLWISDEAFQTINITDESMGKFLEYFFYSIPADSTRGVFEYVSDLLGVVRKNYFYENEGERTIDILGHIYPWSYLGLASTYRSQVNLYKYDSEGNQAYRPGHEAYARVIAHEYIHNVHLAYGVHSYGLDFFIEALAEWISKVIMFDQGNILRTGSGLDATYPRPGAPLFPAHPFRYDKAKMFGIYFGERVGLENIKNVIHVCKPEGICDSDNPDDGDWHQGIDGLEYALSLLDPPIPLSGLVEDYHTTSFVNGYSIFLDGVKYGYETPRYAEWRISIFDSDMINIEEINFSEEKLEIQPGGYNYLAYNNPVDLHLSIQKSHDEVTAIRLFKEKGGTKELVDLESDVNEYTISGAYDRVTLIAVHNNPRPDQPEITLNISATQKYEIIAIEGEEIPMTLALEQNYPNPFNPSTFIRWAQPQAGQVRLAVYNMLGQKVATLIDEIRSAGRHEIRLEASDWTSGVYVYALEANGRTLTDTMVLLK